MQYKIFIIIGAIMTVPLCLLLINELIISIKHKKYKSVRVSKILFAVCFVGAFVSVFAFASNLYAYVTDGDVLWFVIMMGIVYLGMNVCLFLMHREKIFYSEAEDNIILIKGFKKIKAYKKQITRFYLSDEYIDFYIGDERIRYGNNFLTGTLELNDFVKNVNLQ